LADLYSVFRSKDTEVYAVRISISLPILSEIFIQIGYLF